MSAALATATATATAAAPSDQALLETSARGIMALALVSLADYVAKPNADPEIVIKIVNSKIADIGKTIPEKRNDPNSGLRVFNITFNNGRFRGSVEPSATTTLELVEEVGAACETLDDLGFLDDLPAHILLASANMNSDIADLLEAHLDD